MEGKIVMGGSDIAVIDVAGIFIMVAMVSGIVLYAVRWATYAADQTLEASSRDWDKKNQRKKRIYISGPITGNMVMP